MKFGLNRSQLKNIALVFMVLDNAWLRFSTSFSSVAHLITRFVAPLFAWLMVDGFFHTKSRGRYCRRLWIAAILMQIGNVISFGLFGQRGITDNIFLTLAFGFTIIWLFELAKNVEQRWKKVWLRVGAIVLTVLGLALSIILIIPLPFGSDIMLEGGLQLIPFILFAYFFRDSKWKQSGAVFIYSIVRRVLSRVNSSKKQQRPKYKYAAYVPNTILLHPSRERRWFPCGTGLRDSFPFWTWWTAWLSSGTKSL